MSHRDCVRLGTLIFLIAAEMLQAQSFPQYPKTLYECDVLPSRKNCATWILSGQIYSASWPDTGALGNLSIQRFDSNSVVLQRSDASGTMQGMTATYTGQWDGSSIRNGKVTWTWNGHTGSNTWTATTQAPQSVVAEQKAVEAVSVPASLYQYRVNGGNDKYGVSNGFSAPLTAYVIRGGQRDGNPWTHVEDFRVTQADPLPPGQKRDDPTLWQAGLMPIGLKVIAAIFADGTARGDPEWVNAVMDKRREQIWVYETMARTICTMARQRQTGEAIVTTLIAKKNDYVRNTSKMRFVNLGGEQAYTAVIKSLGSGPNSAASALATVRVLSNKLRTDPVKNPNGGLYLSDALAPASCSVP